MTGREGRGTTAPEQVGAALVAWFAREGRDLPWRRTRDPYAIWVAEVLLQQTRVDQALPYYERFLRAFPTLRALAEAPRDRVLKVWEGAGYYGRAHRLHQAAQELVDHHRARLPSTAGELEQLPGFGPYTSRSVAAIAFGQPEVALDANALRVLARLFLLRGEGSALRARAEEVGRAALGDRAPRAFNEGLMELGQRFCSARAPRCDRCPLNAVCRARAELDDPSSLPPMRKAAPRPRVEAAVGILEREGRILVGQRPADGLLGGLWEFPGGKLEPKETPRQAVVREFREETGLTTRVVRALGTVEHDYSHFHATLHVFLLAGRGASRPRGPGPLRWVLPEELARLALPVATRKMLKWVPPAAPTRPRATGR